MTDPVTLRVDAEFMWDPGEYARVVGHLTREKLRSGGWRLFFFAAAAWLLWTFGSIILAALDDGDWLSGFIAMLPWILFVAFWAWVFRGGGGALAARRAVRLDPRVDRLQHHVVDASGIHVDTGQGSMSLPWTGMAGVVETDESFLWYWHAEAAHYTPKRALTERDIDTIRDLIIEHIPDRAQLAP